LIKVKFIITALFLILFFSCSNEEKDKSNVVDFGLDKITERGKLIAITGYNAYSYFIYRGQPMGYEYELIKRLADYLNLELEIKVVKEIPQMFKMLNNGEGDIIAFNLTVTKNRKEQVAFTHHHNITRQVLVQRRPENWYQMAKHEIDRQLIRTPLDLENKTVHVRFGSSYIERLENLTEEMGAHINIVEAAPELSTEDLIRMVSEGKIEYTISDRNIALLQQAYYSNIDISTDISLPQKIAWAVRKNAPALLDTVNSWIDEIRKTPDYYVIYNKYYKNRLAFRKRLGSDYFSLTGGRISQYDEIIKEYADELNFDWRILAALIYQESQFKIEAQSWAGAKGLMQLMPATAEQFGADDLTDPMQNLDAGMRYLKWLDDYWYEFVPDSTERVKFVLASYNIGPGHIEDARALAEKYGADPNIWEGNVAEYLLKKSTPKYYNDEVVKYGYARGTETVAYVRQVLEIYEHYKQFIS
jgi:membrane-bound lytic murein transglycosylase F